MDPIRYARSEFEPCTPPPNVHNKHQPEPPERSRKTCTIRLARAIEAGKRLQCVIGVVDPIPFVTPPAMPQDLEQELVSGMKEYGSDIRMQSTSTGLDVLSQVASMQERLPEIKNENESPGKAAWALGRSGGEGEIFCSSPVWLSDVQSTPSKDPKKSMGDGADEQQTTALAPSEMSDAEFEVLVNEPIPSLCEAGQQVFVSSLLDKSQPVYASYDTPSSAASRKQMDAFEKRHMPAHSQGNLQMGSDDVSTSSSDQNSDYGDAFTSISGYRSVSRVKPLFPSPRVGAGSWDENNGVSQEFVAPVQRPPATTFPPEKAFFENLFRQPLTTHVPRIAIQTPSPTKLPSFKKRLSPQTADEPFGPALKDIRPNSKKATGLPILPASSSALWELDFPGYTPALLTVLLTWSHAMQSFYRRLPDPKTFPMHAAFPHRITPPAYNHLISVGFYDTSIVPHKEIRFLGPGDAAEIGYAEVDVFRSKEKLVAFDAQKQEHVSKMQAMKRKLGFGFGCGEPDAKVSVYQDQVHLAMGGEGRWAYVLIKGHATSEEKEEVVPHVVLTWHLSAVTDTSTCLHTVFPDKDEPVLGQLPAMPITPKQLLRRLASLQNLVSPSRGQKHLHREIRSGSSSAELPGVEESKILSQEGAQTLKRTVVKLEKAGSVPLIEGYRVDLKHFRGWLDAVGRGEAKVVVWRE
ncbi:hypothetical protein G6011_05892 [Alternaria panax]|uniref:Uncharacterized protein n=1 Tax=Alternaria panax TaxID=48097 RepID=A0AAD4FEG3_9PLEO|nr:hypothetical protein G6011_05892 [Alternaria panax]